MVDATFETANMAIVIITATILEFWFDILNPFKICGQMIYNVRNTNQT